MKSTIWEWLYAYDCPQIVAKIRGETFSYIFFLIFLKNFDF